MEQPPVKRKSTSIYADLREDQWDLICMALEHVRRMTLGTESQYAIDTLGRKFLRRCADETIKDIQRQVTDAKVGDADD